MLTIWFPRMMAVEFNLTWMPYPVPDVVHVLVDGRIAKSGGKELALQLEEKGYDWLREDVESTVPVQER